MSKTVWTQSGCYVISTVSVIECEILSYHVDLALIIAVKFDGNPPTYIRGIVLTNFNIEKFNTSRAVTLPRKTQYALLDLALIVPVKFSGFSKAYVKRPLSKRQKIVFQD